MKTHCKKCNGLGTWETRAVMHHRGYTEVCEHCKGQGWLDDQLKALNSRKSSNESD